MSRPGLTDEEFALLEPLLPEERPKRPGRPYNSHRIFIDGIFWILRTGAPWRDLPDRYGPWESVYSRLRRWQLSGLWERILQTLQSRNEQRGEFCWCFGAMDSSVVRAHKAAAGASKDGEDGKRLSPDESREQQGLGTSRGGLTTKIHIIVEGQGRPVVVRISPGQQHDVRQVIPLLDDVSVVMPEAPRTNFDIVIADKAYDSQAVRDELQKRDSKPVVAHRRNQQGEYPESAKDFDKHLYRQRNIVERAFGHLKELRRIATRYEKLASRYLTMVRLGIIRMWLSSELSRALA